MRSRLQRARMVKANTAGAMSLSTRMTKFLLGCCDCLLMPHPLDPCCSIGNTCTGDRLGRVPAAVDLLWPEIGPHSIFSGVKHSRSGEHVNTTCKIEKALFGDICSNMPTRTDCV